MVITSPLTIVLIFVLLLVYLLFIDQVGIVKFTPRVGLREWERKFRRTPPPQDREHHLVVLQLYI